MFLRRPHLLRSSGNRLVLDQAPIYYLVSLFLLYPGRQQLNVSRGALNRYFSLFAKFAISDEATRPLGSCKGHYELACLVIIQMTWVLRKHMIIQSNNNGMQCCQTFRAEQICYFD